MTKHLDAEACGKTLNEAVETALEKALAQLNLSREDVEYELVDQKKSGLFGLGDKIVTIRVSYEEAQQGAKERAAAFLNGLFERMHTSVGLQITETKDEDGSRLDIILVGEDMGPIIGRRGETLDAIQYLTGLAVNKGNDSHVRVTVNTENYREKREDYLLRLARKTADRAVRCKRSITLDAMVPHDRRVIHASLQGVENVRTYSVGQDPNRRVIVAYDGPDAQRRPGGDHRSNGPRRNNYRRSGGETGQSLGE